MLPVSWLPVGNAPPMFTMSNPPTKFSPFNEMQGASALAIECKNGYKVASFPVVSQVFPPVQFADKFCLF